MPGDMLFGLWEAMSSRRMHEVNAHNHAAAFLHQHECAKGSKQSSYKARDSYPYQFADASLPAVDEETRKLVKELAIANEIPLACLQDLLRVKIINPKDLIEWQI
jgi:hypothetical protein